MSSFYFYKMQFTTAPIGIFDSGVGGTSIWKEIHALLPFENTLYLADSKHAPYGIRSTDEIISLSIKNTEFLLHKGCKIIVVACNTATTNAIDVLRSKYSIPFIGIEPAIKPAALQTQSKAIGILATQGTLSSDLFHKTSKEFAKDIEVIEVIGEGLVPLIESGEIESPLLHQKLEQFIAPMIQRNIDHLVLGCSHYPYLIPTLRKLLSDTVKIIDSGAAVAKQTKAVLKEKECLNLSNEKPKLSFLSNKNASTLKLLLQDYSEKISIHVENF